MIENSVHAYLRLTAAVFMAYVIFGSTVVAFNCPSSLSVPPQPSSSSSSGCRLPTHSTLPTRSKNGSLGNHHRQCIPGRIGSNSIRDEFDFFGSVLFASAYDNDETSATGSTCALIVVGAAPTIMSTLVLDDDDDDDGAGNTSGVQDNTIIGGENSHDVTDKIMQSSVTTPSSSKSSSTYLSSSLSSTNTHHHHLIAPSIPKILRYTIPAIGIWLCSPVLSMIDTASVGLLSGTAQQAALNPAASVTDCGALVIAFMYTATTNLIAAAVREDEDDADDAQSTAITKNRYQPKTTKTLITALKLALLVGTTFAMTLMSTAPKLLQLLMGNSASALDPVVYSAALRYIRIRALGMPAMAVIGTAQSACLGMQDVRSPLYVLLAAAVINFLGDVALVPLKSNLWGGAAGAAWATVASQYAAMSFFARWLTMRKSDDTAYATTYSTATDDDDNKIGSNRAGTRKRRVSQFWMSRRKEGMITTTDAEYISLELSNSRVRAIDEGNGNHLRADSAVQQTSQQALSSEQATSQTKIRGFLSDSKLTLRAFLSLHNLDKNKVKEFFPFVIPVTTTSIGRISGYIAMSHVSASTLGTFDMAAHQIILSIFCCITPFVDALSQVAQSFVPAVFEAKERSQERANALRKTVNNFRLVGLGFGGVLVSLVACIPMISRYFTTDLVVLERVHSAIAPVGLFMLVNGLMCAGEGKRSFPE